VWMHGVQWAKKGTTNMLELLCIRSYSDDADVPKYREMAGLGSELEYSAKADQARSAGNIRESVKCLALAGKPKEAVELALATLQQQLGEAHCDYDEVLRLNEVLGAIRMADMPDELLHRTLAFSFYLGALQAMWRGYRGVVRHLFAATRQTIAQHSIDFPVAAETITMHEATFVGSFDRPAAAELLRGVNGVLKSDAERLRNHLLGEFDLAKSEANNDNQYKPAGSALSSGARGQGISLVSHLSKAKISGPAVHLMKPKGMKSSELVPLSLDEALMWSRVCAHSPAADGAHVMWL